MALSDALPRLRADESLEAAARAALGSGWMRPDDARDLQRHWRAESEGAPRRRSRPSLADVRANAAALGIAVVNEQRRVVS